MKSMKGKVTAFCEYCEDEKLNYKLVKEKYTHKINGTVYEFYEYVAYCPDCGEPLDVPGLIDINVSYMVKQYHIKEGGSYAKRNNSFVKGSLAKKNNSSVREN